MSRGFMAHKRALRSQEKAAMDALPKALDAVERLMAEVDRLSADLSELRQCYRREGLEAFIRKHFPDMLEQEGYPGIAHDFEMAKKELRTATVNNEQYLKAHRLITAERNAAWVERTRYRVALEKIKARVESVPINQRENDEIAVLEFADEALSEATSPAPSDTRSGLSRT